MYAIDSSRAFYELDITNGSRTSLGTVSANAGTTAGLAYDEGTGTTYLTSTSTDSLYTLNLTTLAATLVGAYGDSSIVMHGLEIANGNLYGASGGGGNYNFYQINKNTGVANLIGGLGTTSFTNLGFNSDTGVMYATHSADDSLYTVDLNTGALTLVGPLLGPTNPHGLAYNRDNQTMYVICSNTDTLYTVNLQTGAATVVGLPGSGNYLGLVYVPESGYRVTGSIHLNDTVAAPTFSRAIAVKLTQGSTVINGVANVFGTGNYALTVPSSVVGAATL